MSGARLAALEALADPRLGPISGEELATELARHGLVLHRHDLPSRDESTRSRLDEARRGRPIEWARRTLTYGQVLDTFARHCREELGEVAVVGHTPVRLDLAWRRERAALELRAGPLFCERLVGRDPLLLLADLSQAVVERLLDDARLRSRLAVYDLIRLEKVSTVRCSIFVHFEWFLRDAYGVKVLPAPAFTQGLVDRGIISLGFG
jgi:hypothetical protein